MTKTIVSVSFSRTNHGWTVSTDNRIYRDAIEKTGIPDEMLGDVLEATAYYVENDLGCECNFYCE